MIPSDRKGIFLDFCLFARLQKESKDLDPMYPFLRAVYDSCDLSPDEEIWRTLIYVAFYSLDATVALWKEFPKPALIRRLPKVLPTGVERRGFRGPKGNALAVNLINRCIESSKAYGGLWAWVREPASLGGERGWTAIRSQFLSIKGNGSWASYKWADLMKNTHGFKIRANDLGAGGGSETAGPIPGLARLTGLPWKRCCRDGLLHRAILKQSRLFGSELESLDELETALCDFNSMSKGTYYVGHDIDVQMENIPRGETELWRARAAAIPSFARGECGGWFGVNRERKFIYRDTNQILSPSQGR